jgi:hypothetical protein
MAWYLVMHRDNFTFTFAIPEGNYFHSEAHEILP